MKKDVLKNRLVSWHLTLSLHWTVSPLREGGFHPQCMESCLTSGKSSISICWRNKFLLHIHPRAPLGPSLCPDSLIHELLSIPDPSWSPTTCLNQYLSLIHSFLHCWSPVHFSAQLQCNPTPSPKLLQLFPRAIDGISGVHEHFSHILKSACLVICPLWSHLGGVPCYGHRGWYSPPPKKKNHWCLYWGSCLPALRSVSPRSVYQSGAGFPRGSHGFRITQWSLLLVEKTSRLRFSGWHSFSYNHQVGLLTFVVFQSSSVSSWETSSPGMSAQAGEQTLQYWFCFCCPL